LNLLLEPLAGGISGGDCWRRGSYVTVGMLIMKIRVQ